MRFLSTVAAAALATTAFAGAADAYTITSPASISLANFGNAPSTGFLGTTLPGISGATFTSSGGLTGLYAGNVHNGFQGSATTPFTPSSSLQEYLAVQPGGTITETFATAQTSLGLLWGTVDSFNSLSITVDGVTITGSQIVPFPLGNINQTVLISGLGPFTTVTYNDTAFSAFEFDPGLPVGVPEPVSMAVLGAGLLGLGIVRRRRGA